MTVRCSYASSCAPSAFSRFKLPEAVVMPLAEAVQLGVSRNSLRSNTPIQAKFLAEECLDEHLQAWSFSAAKELFKNNLSVLRGVLRWRFRLQCGLP